MILFYSFISHRLIRISFDSICFCFFFWLQISNIKLQSFCRFFAFFVSKSIALFISQIWLSVFLALPSFLENIFLVSTVHIGLSDTFKPFSIYQFKWMVIKVIVIGFFGFCRKYSYTPHFNNHSVCTRWNWFWFCRSVQFSNFHNDQKKKQKQMCIIISQYLIEFNFE